MNISIVIPVFREQDLINEAIGSIRAMPSGRATEIIVADGGADRETLDAIRDNEVKRIAAGRGRGRQMNVGAAAASGDVLLFLHVDTRLPSDGLERIAALMDDARYPAGAFDLGISASGLSYRIIERVASRRSRLTGIPYGDQAIFVRRNYFIKIGGYRDLPIMEDVDLMRRIRKDGGMLCFVGERVMTSARRWQKEGIVRCTCRNWTIMLLYLSGVSPKRLARWYPASEGSISRVAPSAGKKPGTL
jgi:rSAM/selenodomain-associated transferase 2